MAYFGKYKDTDGNEFWRYTLSAGRHPITRERQQISRRSFVSEAAARKACSIMERELEKGLRVDKSNTLLSDFIKMFFETKVVNQVSEGTYNSQWIMVQKYIIPKLGRFKLNKINVERVDVFYNELLRDGVSRGYIKNIAMVLSKTFKQAVTWNYIVKNVVKEAPPPSYKPKKVAVWSEDQLITFLNATRHIENHALYVLGGTSGMRIGELLALQWTDIDEHKKIISITKSLKYTKSKGLHLSSTKTENSERTIIVPQSTIDALIDYKRQQLPGTEIVFDNVGEYMYPSEAWRRFNTDCANAGLPRMKIHGLRHTHATLLLSKGFNPKVVAERLGDTVETVMRTYAHVLPNMQKEVAASLENVYKTVDNFSNVVKYVVKDKQVK